MNELTKRLFSAFVLSSLYIIAISIKNDYRIIMFFLCLLLGIFALKEYYSMVDRKNNSKPKVTIGILALTILVLMTYLHVLKIKFTQEELGFFKSYINFIEYNIDEFLGLIFAFIIIIFFQQLLTNKIEGAIFSISSTLFGLIYISIPTTHLLLLSAFKNGIFYICFTVWATVMSDAMAYFFGKLLGRHSIGFKVSPNKTYEGYIGGLIGQIISTHIFYFFYQQYFITPNWSPLLLTLICIIVYITSVMGDLSASLLKRDADIKDSGKIIPGHGGVLDTFDALFFTIPGMYYSIIFINKFN